MTDFETNEASMTRIDTAIVSVVSLTILFAALSFGAVLAWAEEVVQVAAIVIAGLTAYRAWSGLRDSSLARTGGVPGYAILPVVLFVMLVLLQLTPLSQPIADKFSPNAASLRAELLADLSNSATELRDTTVSLYTEPGWDNLRMLLSAAVVFVACASLARSRPARNALVFSLSLVGVAIASVALAHQIFGVTKIWGEVTLEQGKATRSAPFVNHSHFAQFMNLSLGFAIAVALQSAMTFRVDERPRGPGDWWAGFREGRLNRVAIALLAGIVLTMAMTLSGSRGGLISFAAGAALVAGVGSIRSGTRKFVLSGAAVLAIIAVLVWAASDHVAGRVSDLSQSGSGGERLVILKSLVPAWRSFPIFGTGLGTFEYVFPMYDKTKAINLYSHAENEYAQLLLETGGVGLAIILSFIVIVWIAFARCIARGGRSAQLALGLGFGFLAILVHSGTDFGQHIPANAMMTACATGVIVGMARPRERKASRALLDVRIAKRRATFSCAFAVIVAGILLAFLPAADVSRRAEANYKTATKLIETLAADGWQGDDDRYAAALAPAATAAELSPRNVKINYDYVVLKYFSLIRQPGRFLRDDLRTLVDRLNTIRVNCPTFGPAYSMAGQILQYLGEREAADKLIESAMRLTSYDGVTIYLNAERAMARGDVDSAKKLFRRATDLLAARREDVIERFITQYKRPADALELADQDLNYLRVAETSLRKANETALADEAKQRYLAALRKLAESGASNPGALYELSRVLLEQGDKSAAKDFLAQAVFRQPDQPDWQLQLAVLCEETGDRAAAIEHAESAVRNRPSWDEAVLYLAKLRTPTTRP